MRPGKKGSRTVVAKGKRLAVADVKSQIICEYGLLRAN